jgi:hypothetical protein
MLIKSLARTFVFLEIRAKIRYINKLIILCKKADFIFPKNTSRKLFLIA